MDKKSYRALWCVHVVVPCLVSWCMEFNRFPNHRMSCEWQTVNINWKVYNCSSKESFYFFPGILVTVTKKFLMQMKNWKNFLYEKSHSCSVKSHECFSIPSKPYSYDFFQNWYSWTIYYIAWKLTYFFMLLFLLNIKPWRK